MDAERLEQHVRDICSVSRFFDPRRYDILDLSDYRWKEYLSRSHKRLDVLVSKFDELGFKVEKEEFGFRHKAVNAIFRRGRKRKNEIWFVAHHDYSAGLGAEDNASALAVMLEVARHSENSNVVFASFDLEEQDLAGSKHYVKNSDLSKIKYVIALECLGSGRDITICKSVSGAKSDKRLVKKLEETAASLSYNFIPEDYYYFSADHAPFARKGVKTAEIWSLNHALYLKYGGNKIFFHEGNVWRFNAAHTKRDLPENLNYENLVKVGEVLVKFLELEC